MSAVGAQTAHGECEGSAAIVHLAKNVVPYAAGITVRAEPRGRRGVEVRTGVPTSSSSSLRPRPHLGGRGLLQRPEAGRETSRDMVGAPVRFWR